MFENEQEKSKATLQAEENLRRAKQQLLNAKKKDNEKKRKAENHHKYMMGGIIVKYFPECYQFEESELKQILATAIRSAECQKVIQRIKEQSARNGAQTKEKTGGVNDNE